MNRSIFYIFAVLISIIFSQSVSANLALPEDDSYINFEFKMELSQRQDGKQSILFSLSNLGNVPLIANRDLFSERGILSKEKCNLFDEHGKEIEVNKIIKLHTFFHSKEDYFVRLLPGEFIGFIVPTDIIEMRHITYGEKYKFQCTVDSDQLLNEEGLSVKASTKQVDFYLPKNHD